MNRRATRWMAALLLATCGMARAERLPPDPVPLAKAREVALRAIELAESRGLPPRRQAEFTQARSAVLAVVGGGEPTVDRHLLYARIDTMLDTLDADGHSFVLTPAARATHDTAPIADADGPRFALVETAAGKVLRWTPPPVTDPSPAGRRAWLKGFLDDAAAMPGLQQACALVVDLGVQQGGDAWPPFIAMHPLFSGANSAAVVGRDGRRTPLVNADRLREGQRESIGDAANPLARFAGLPIGVVVGRSTASAGEMLLVALLGEGRRVGTFGWTSHGMTTVNEVHVLPDGAALVPSERRYALGDAAVLRGGIAPQHAALPDEPHELIVQHAAQWAASRSQGCKNQSSTYVMK